MNTSGKRISNQAQQIVSNLWANRGTIVIFGAIMGLIYNIFDRNFIFIFLIELGKFNITLNF